MATNSSGLHRKNAKKAARFYVVQFRHWRLLLITVFILGCATLLVRQLDGSVDGEEPTVAPAISGAVTEADTPPGPVETRVPQAKTDDVVVPVSVPTVVAPQQPREPVSSVEPTRSAVPPAQSEPPATDEPARKASVGAFDDLRAERERTRSRQAESLQQVVDDPRMSAEKRDEARARLEKLWTLSLREMEVEQLLLTDGYRGIVVVSDDRAHVYVEGVLDDTAAARIGELVVRVIGIGREHIYIVDALSLGG